MALTSHLRQQVSRKVRQRGGHYYRSRAVFIHTADANSVVATVEGGDTYEVSLSREASTLNVSCTCPYFQGGSGPCKHIWATLLAAEDKGFLLDARGQGPRSLVEDFGDTEEWDGEDSDYGDGEEWYEDEQELEDEDQAVGPDRYPPRARLAPRKRDWKAHLRSLRQGVEQQAAWTRTPFPPGQQLLYVVDVPGSMVGNGLAVELMARVPKKDGTWAKPRGQPVAAEQIALLPDPSDRRILSLLGGSDDGAASYGYSYSSHNRYRLSPVAAAALLSEICQTGRCFLQAGRDAELQPLRWDDGPAWEFRLEVVRDASGRKYWVNGSLSRGPESLPLATPALITRGGLVFCHDQVARLEEHGAFDWIGLLRREGPLRVPAGQTDKLVRELVQLPHLPPLDLPEELRFEQVALSPRPRLKVKPAAQTRWRHYDRLRGELSFDYDGAVVASNQPGGGLYQPEKRRLLVRNVATEQAAAERLRQLGFRPASYYSSAELELAPRNLPGVVRTLLEEGWYVEAEGKLYRRPGAIHIELTSGIDWFDLQGTVEFGDTVAQLPELLASLKRGENTVRLDDGTFGILPEEWLKKYGVLAGLGNVEDDKLRFRKNQVGLLDALLASQPEARFDAAFTQARDELRAFDGIKPEKAPAGFQGQLRGYQEDGLGWLHFLQRFGFGGCLADDMGLGKTVQVLALLDSRRQLRADGQANGKRSRTRLEPSLVVAPRSLVFNWKQEAARFTPQLRMLDHSGIGRERSGNHFQDYDVVLTTYGTLRRDALLFKDVLFDYCILDEAQAIKNANSESAKAVRLLQGRHRLALSGTPVENHLGELWSLFEFLNPGMLGSASVFRLGGVAARNPDPESRALLARALRPFILRRTKAQVASDLPQKVEQTVYCELEPAQRKQYDELRDHYRQTLLGRIEREGINKAKMQILEALLRLRQAACHPGLIDKKKTSASSAKLDALLPQLAEVLEENHKALVFSQFTSLLAIVRNRLDREQIVYEYLDGRTRDRGSRVERFQTDPDCKLFLISLKAGGLGLNLTAAEYIFLLDPWWNPAVEAQAIDRAHRIGQTRNVFAYRLIARDTVEEKVLELQKSKRALADAIINADNSLLRGLRREDLDLLLS